MKRAGYFGGLAGAHRHSAARPLRPPRRARQADGAAIGQAMAAPPRLPTSERAVTRSAPDRAVPPSTPDRALTTPTPGRPVIPPAASAAAISAPTPGPSQRLALQAPSAPVRPHPSASAADGTPRRLRPVSDIEPPNQTRPPTEAIAPGPPGTRPEEPIAHSVIAPSARATTATLPGAHPQPAAAVSAPAPPGASTSDSLRRTFDDPPAAPPAAPAPPTRAASAAAPVDQLPPLGAPAPAIERHAPATLTPRPATPRAAEPTPGPARRPVPPDQPARVHIGTIDVTIVPPDVHEPRPVTGPSFPAAAPTPAAAGSLSRGPGPWYGLGQR